MGRYDNWLSGEPHTPPQEAIPEQPDAISYAPPTPTSGEAAWRDIDELSSEPGDIEAHEPQQEDPVHVALPSTIAERAPTTGLQTRYNGHKGFNDQIREDWMRIIEDSPDAFQALLFRPSNGTFGITVNEDGEEVFTELDNNQRDLRYDDPVIVWVLDNPDGRDSFQVIDSDGEQDGLTDDVLILRVASNNVLLGSVLEWNEETANGEARRWWYVHRIFGYGTQHVGSLYYCIPARNFDKYPTEKNLDCSPHALGEVSRGLSDER